MTRVIAQSMDLASGTPGARKAFAMPIGAQIAEVFIFAATARRSMEIDTGAKIMTCSRDSRRGTANLGKKQGEVVLTHKLSGQFIDISELGTFRVSEEANRDINRVEARAARVMATSARFAFR